MRPAVALGITTLLLAIGAFLFIRLRAVPPPRPPTSRPATEAVTIRPASPPAAATRTIASYADFITAIEPRLGKAKPLQTAVAMNDAAGFICRDPIHLDLRGDLWVTHPDAPRIADILRDAGKEQAHVTRDEVVFVHWSRDAKNNWVAQPVTRQQNHFIWHAPAGPRPLPRNDYRFDALILFDNKVFVPTEEGVAVLAPPPASSAAQSSAPLESFIAIPTGQTPVCVFPLQGGVVAFRPWDNGDAGSDTVVRHGPQGWTTLPEGAFPPMPIHAFAMTDGSSLVLSAGPEAGLDLSVQLPLDPKPVDEKTVEALAERLNSAKSTERTEAQAELARFGPSAWVVLERLRDAQTPEAQRIIDRLLGGRAKPALGIFTLLPGPVRLVSRAPDGTIALYTLAGVNYLDNNQEQLRAPALLLARPGKPVQIVHETVAAAHDPATIEVQLHSGEFIVTDRLLGPTTLNGNHLAPMLRPEHRGFLLWQGSDRRKRSLFLNPATRQRLLLDPNYPDLTPRLPACVMNFEGTTVWDDQNYARMEKDGLWKLEAAGWTALKKDHAIRTDPPAPSPILLTLPDGQIVTGGIEALEFASPSTNPATTPAVTRESAKSVTLPLPPVAMGQPPVTLIRAPDGNLFLFNRPGRVLRFSPNGNGGYALDATFTKDIPSMGIRRIWLDPLGRICIVHDTNKLTLLFPEGRIPREIANLTGSSSP